MGDDAYCYTITHHVLPALRDFEPDFIFVACGFDTLGGDPYASMTCTPAWFGWLAALMIEENICPMVWNLEGGCKCAAARRHCLCCPV